MSKDPSTVYFRDKKGLQIVCTPRRSRMGSDDIVYETAVIDGNGRVVNSYALYGTTALMFTARSRGWVEEKEES